MKKKKRGSVSLFEFIFGLIIGIVLLIFFIFIANKLFFPEKTKDYVASFENFAEGIKSLEGAQAFSANTQILQIRKGDVIFGINKVAENSQGRLGDGNLYVLFGGERVLDYLYNTTVKREGATATNMYYRLLENKVSLRIERPIDCLPENSCVCLCTQAQAVDPETPYEVKQELYYQAISTLQSYVNPNIEVQKSLSCVSLQCKSVGDLTFYESMKAQEFTSKTYYSENMPPVNTDENPFMIENGFVLPRIEDAASFERLYWEGSINQKNYYVQTTQQAHYFGHHIESETNAVSAMKLVNGQVAVCLSPTCFATINAKIRQEETDNRIQEQMIRRISINELFPNTDFQVTETCQEQPLDVLQEQEELIAQLAYKISSRHDGNAYFDLNDIQLQRVIGQDEIHIMFLDDKMQIQLVRNCPDGTYAFVTGIQITRLDNIHFDTHCYNSEIVARGGNVIHLETKLLSQGGNRDEARSINYITCPRLQS